MTFILPLQPSPTNKQPSTSSAAQIMRPYHHYDRAALARFAKNRRLRVSSTGKSMRHPLKKDYIHALNEADENRSFDFFGLPPELRNMVYKELLTLNASYTCHPQILRALMNVNSEASNILYGDNIMEVKVYRDGVYVRGRKCGDYIFDLAHDVRDRFKADGTLEWPNVIRQIRSIRFSVESNAEPFHQTLNWIPRLGSLHYIIHSFASFLASDHKLRSLVVDLTQLRTLLTRNRALQDFEESVGTALCPLRLVASSIKVLRVEGTSNDLSFIFDPPTSVSNNARQFLPASPWSIMKTMYSTHSAEMSIISGGRYKNMTRSFALYATWARLRAAGINTPSRLRKTYLAHSVSDLRKLWDAHRGLPLPDVCLSEIIAILQFEIEVKVLMSLHG